MATTEAGLCNLALLRVGQRQTIEDLGDDTEEARACNALYADSRDAVLAELDWRFARRRAVLATLTLTRSGWSYVYALPTHCIAARFIYPGTLTPAAEQRIPYELELDDDGQEEVLLTNEAEAELIYTWQVEDVARFPPLFVQALAWKLASELALALPVKPQVGLAMLQGYERALGGAVAANLREVQEGQPPEAESIRARG